MFLLGLGKKNQEAKSETIREKIERNTIRSCSKCGNFFEVIYENDCIEGEERNESDLEDFESPYEEFSKYMNLNKQNPYYLEDFILQFIEISIEKDHEIQSKNIDDSLCLNCINELISEFTIMLNKANSKLDKLKGFSKNIESNDFEDSSNIINIFNDYRKRKNMNKSSMLNSESKLEDNKSNKTEEVFEIIDLKINQNKELDLAQEVVECSKLKEGLSNHYKFLKDYLEKLQRTNLLNMIFYIDHNNGVGTINGLKLGLFSGDFDNWNEINASLGTASLLLYCILEKYGMNLSINPKGSYSTIMDLSSNVTWPLYGSRLCNSDYNECKNFDNGISTFIKLIYSTYENLLNKEIRLPFEINVKENKIGGISANLLFSDKKIWNKAMKMMLINLKWLLVKSCEVENN